MSNQFNWKSLNGKKGKFYGVHNDCFKIGSVVLRAVEDEEDGYRSSLHDIEIVEDYKDMVFSETSLADIIICTDSNFLRLYEQCSEDGGATYRNYLWLEVGTDDTDSYYPFFVFNYNPKISDTVDRTNEIIGRLQD